jgi:tRNA uridine 5-carboxymethylaminomethyl modification enzyme
MIMERMKKVMDKKQRVEKIKNDLKNYPAEPEEINGYLEEIGSAPILQKQKITQVLLRPNVELKGLVKASEKLNEVLNENNSEVIEQVEIQVKYDVYINKEKELVERMSQLDELLIPDTFSYDKIHSLSNEARQKFLKIRPRTLGQASRISGVNPSDVQILMVYMGR